MTIDRSFSLYPDPDGVERQFLTASAGLGRILDMPALRELVASFGSELSKRSLDQAATIKPPIPDSKIAALGEALVAFVTEKEPGVDAYYYSRVKNKARGEAAGELANTSEDFPDTAEEPPAG